MAYGGKYEHSPEREIGVFPINLTEAGLADDHIKDFGSTLDRHGEGIRLLKDHTNLLA